MRFAYLTLVSLLASTMLSSGANAQDKSGDGLLGPDDVTIERSEEGGEESSYTDIYSLALIDSDCTVYWQFEKGNAEYPDDRLIYDTVEGCEGKTFADLIPLNGTVLMAIAEKEKLGAVKTLVFFGLIYDGDDSYASKIASASAADKAYQAGSESAEDAFVRLVNKSSLIDDLDMLLFTDGLKGTAISADKVAEGTPADYTGKTKPAGLSADTKILWDAEYVEFELSPQTGLPKALQ